MPVTEETVTTKYLHHKFVDGNNIYGGVYKSFPRRAFVGNCWLVESSYVIVPMSPGSRSIASHNGTAYTDGGVSN